MVNHADVCRSVVYFLKLSVTYSPNLVQHENRDFVYYKTQDQESYRHERKTVH